MTNTVRQSAGTVIAGAAVGGQFAASTRTEADGAALAAENPYRLPQQPGEELQWLIGLDDHEYIMVSATSSDEAEQSAKDSMGDRYDETYEGPTDVLGAFRENDDYDADETYFWVPDSGVEESEANRALERAEDWL